MATRAELFIPSTDGRWWSVYLHYDGRPEFVLPALAAHDPSAILAGRDLRSLTVDRIEPLDDPRGPLLKDDLTVASWASHAYALLEGGWREIPVS